ncbi:nuclear transport factor 2 family protein [Mucilaginibacter sp. Bleaf8]|uniref:nuclear transport factor 2 family protein n=1 Tax=Mucilaginibacter sp. Bleaf8 TaxID=2834430 RepID=UPI001BCFD9D9|nr:nuclear transport factor 2 family protein [Mucilaginibacter sp. Bleaf8]MBS7563864.1 nuclear transport factor 2 family protein [Mucilaginibacter sp. Bleaf8]
MDIKEIEDRINLKELVDKVSILADQKNFGAQVKLFTENAVSETIAGGATILKLKGRKAMAEAFASFNKAFDTIYHFNGQHVLTLKVILQPEFYIA